MSPKCPKCGCFMCEQFDYKEINEHTTVAVPNGNFICYKCKATKTKQEIEHGN